ncbi:MULTISPECIES: sigma factor-like helix-turn-helix DNA-binding protein [Lactobacillaceae]|jgi:RNA polymerase sigma factor (sigma-70 family)|uniref:Sigma-70 family RNA polymerase sigma factor n=1 Tax=Lactobacillus gasseri TaxID=1596 RepID=A0A833CF58_LACGS|nr:MULTISPECIES: sigma factor-like helix-turn-helix DNA-binding protein [Lactobacillaceae]MCH3989627.1 sigma-70 family RNA polymerase sigma factor [Lactobacillus sp.]DAK80698.1 MAG TPA: RNA polymerase sigma factor [Caudoviricetes sp.]KAB1951009.1 sigma-70 family RNA polymerase sigma factor [Lactobacillus gasseri]KAF0494034.1 sigma-70 family RNA polymerase sigma factor [Pediococcus acidilactici]MCH4068207.1 sigma-70 family RNA polymerase sigma factor [Lactobacillus sp.]
MKTNNSEYELVGEQNNKLIVRVKHMGNQTVVITKAEGNVIFDFDHQQYNSDHRNERHQDKFFKQDPSDPDMNMMDTLADRESIEVTSIYGEDSLLDKIVEKEGRQSRQMLAGQLSTALATLTNKQKYAVTQYYYNGVKKNQIAKKMGISKVMAGRHVKAAIKKLRQFYNIED